MPRGHENPSRQVSRELDADRAGQLAIEVSGAKRLILEPAVQPAAPTKPDGGLDWTRVTAVRLVALLDYHA